MVLVDNNVLSALAKIERLELLPVVFEDVVTPSAVVDELDRAAASGYEFTERIDAVKAYDGGWLDVVTPTDDERQRADEVRNHALSRTDAHCIAITDGRDWRLLTDDARVGTVANQRGVDVWDLALLLQAGIRIDVIETAAELSTIIEELERRDNYRFSDADRDALFETF
jgi:predicted nucleic acid-binding protein